MSVRRVVLSHWTGAHRRGALVINHTAQPTPMTRGIDATTHANAETGLLDARNEMIAEKPGMATASGQRSSLARKLTDTEEVSLTGRREASQELRWPEWLSTEDCLPAVCGAQFSARWSATFSGLCSNEFPRGQ